MSDCTEAIAKHEKLIVASNTQLEALRLEKKGLLTKENEVSEQLSKCTTELNSVKPSVSSAKQCIVDLAIQQEQVIHLEEQALASEAMLKSCMKDVSSVTKKNQDDEQRAGSVLSVLAESQKALEQLELKIAQCQEELEIKSGPLLKMEAVMFDLQKCDGDRDMYANKWKDLDHKCGQIIRQWEMTADTMRMETEMLQKEIAELKQQALTMPTREFLPLEIMERAFTVVRSYVPDRVEGSLRQASEKSLNEVSETLTTTKSLVNMYMFEGYEHGKDVADTSKAYARSLSRQLSEKAPKKETLLKSIDPYVEKMEPYMQKAEPYVQLVTEKLNLVNDKIPYDSIRSSVTEGYNTVQQGVSKGISRIPSSADVDSGLTQIGNYVLSPIKNNPVGSRLLPNTFGELGVLVVVLLFFKIFIRSAVQTLFAVAQCVVCAVEAMFRGARYVLGTVVNVVELLLYCLLRAARFLVKTVLSPLKIFKIVLLPYKLFRWIISKGASSKDVGESTSTSATSSKKNKE